MEKYKIYLNYLVKIFCLLLYSYSYSLYKRHLVSLMTLILFFFSFLYIINIIIKKFILSIVIKMRLL